MRKAWKRPKASAPEGRDLELARLAMRFVVPVSLGGSRRRGAYEPASRGSMTLVQLPRRRVGITCRHVIEAYREQRLGDRRHVFTVGRRPLDPDERLIAEHPMLDLAVLDLDDVDPTSFPAASEESAFFEPEGWPLAAAEPGELIGLGGHASGAVGGGVVGTSRVIDVGLENVVCAPGSKAAAWPAGAGGLSGGAGFARRGSVVHLVGVIFAVAQHGGYLRLRPARLIEESGSISDR